MAKESAVRTRILDVASQLFYKQGYNSTGINQVIAEADIARASLYNHFSSKTELLEAYVEQSDENWFKALDSHLANLKDPRERILGIFDFRMEGPIDENFKGCPFVKVSIEASTEEKKALELVNKNKEHLKSYIKDLIAKIKPEQQLLKADMLAETLFLLMEGASVMANINKQRQSFSSAKKIAKQLLA